jgi:hypothetical protein
LVAEPQAWFDYRWWSRPDDAPKFAKLVDIHRKPGYDPLELFWDRSINGVSQDTSLIKGSHGIVAAGETVCIGDFSKLNGRVIASTEIGGMIRGLLEGD